MQQLNHQKKKTCEHVFLLFRHKHCCLISVYFKYDNQSNLWHAGGGISLTILLLSITKILSGQHANLVDK